MATKKVRTAPSLARVAKRLKSDLATLTDAYQFTETVTREFLEERTGGRVIQPVTTGHAAWVHCTTGDDLETYTQFLDKVLEARKNDEKTLFGWEEPSAVTPSAEADRLLDRIDLGLHFLKRRLQIKLPEDLRGPDGAYSIRNGGGKTAAMLPRVGAFVDAAHDLFAAPDHEAASTEATPAPAATPAKKSPARRRK
ncbi:MAG: hypothetical protein QM820_05180 [Minicystis sp.]